MKSKVNALILGQGLAGTLLSFELIRRGQSVRVIDDGDPQAASRLAAGLVSPITGQRTALMWRAQELLDCAQNSYAALSELLASPLYFPIPLKRFYTSEDQRRRFHARMQQPSHAPWLGSEFQSKGLGGIEIKNTGWLNCARLVERWRERLRGQGCLTEMTWEIENLQSEPSIHYGETEADYAILCCGVKAAAQGPFQFLPFQATKGEILTVKAPEASSDEILYAAHFSIPLGQGRFKVGATYDRQYLDDEPTSLGREQLQTSAQEMLGPSTELLAHQAGIRPNLMGHFPVLGPHPLHSRLLVFNGMGSKGALWAPYCARTLVDWMLEKKEIPKELSVQRFASREKVSRQR